MRKTVYIVAALLTFLFVSVSEGVNWEYFMQNDKGDNYYVDLDSMVHSSSQMVRISRKVEPVAPSAYVSLVSDLELDCGAQRIRVMKETSTDNKGKMKTTGENGKWRDVKAEDMDEILLEFICSLKESGNRP